MRQVVIFILCLVLVNLGVVNASRFEMLSITYEYESTDRNESEQQAVARAYQQAKQEALNKRFGVDVSSIVVSQQQEQTVDGTLEYKDAFYQLGGSVSRGEWIETIREVLVEEPRYTHGTWYVKVHVEGTGRMRNGEPIQISTALINNDHDYEGRKVFYDGDDFYLRFSSPVDGSLLVYLVDAEQQAYCMLPYATSKLGYFPIEANKEYLLFEPTSGFDGYQLTTATGLEQNAVYIVFSPNVVTKAKDEKGGKNWRDEPLPRGLSYKDFLQWLSRHQIRDEQMVVKTEVITIRK